MHIVKRYREDIKTLVIGYYGRDNLGDESYYQAIREFFPMDNLTFVCADDLNIINPTDYKAVIVGGGDIINDYFNRTLRPFLEGFSGPKIAFSVGIPFPSLINKSHLGYFDHVFTRNKEDVRDIQKVIGSTKAHFIPDVSFLYKPSITEKVFRKEPICGIFLVGNILAYPCILDDIASLIGHIALNNKVILYCFAPNEDRQISETVRKLALKYILVKFMLDEENISTKVLSRDRIVVDSNIYTPQQMINNIRNLDFGVCMRYHAHVFCMISGIPFMSISSTRKTRSLMNQASLSEFQYKIELDAYGTPIYSDLSTMKRIYKKVLKNKVVMMNRINTVVDEFKLLLSNHQAEKLLRNAMIDITNNAVELIRETRDYENVARFINDYVLSYPDSSYIWGMQKKFESTNNIAALIRIVSDSIKYLQQHGKQLSKADDNVFTELISHKKLPLYVDIGEYQIYKNVHRGGWYLACEYLSKLSSQVNGVHNGIICDMYVDRTFHWTKGYMVQKGMIPYTSPWCGFIHHTSDTTYSNYNVVNLFLVQEFIISLNMCLFLFTLSEPLSVYIRQRLSLIAPHVKVITLVHPVIIPTITFKGFTKCSKLIGIGSWLRNPYTIYSLKNIPIRKAVLVGKDMNDTVPPPNFTIRYGEGTKEEFINSVTTTTVRAPCRPELLYAPKWISYLASSLISQGIKVNYYKDSVLYIGDKDLVDKLNDDISNEISSVEILKYQPDELYDDLLSKNIVFLDLIDAAAVNTIIECIVRRTPIIVNKIPGTVAMLGNDYPLYYTNLNQVANLVQEDKINAAHKYLLKLDISRYTMRYFLDSIRDILNY